MKFLDVRTDFAFKKVFGSEDSKPRLISFLNAVLDFADGCEIIDLKIIDPYNIPKLKGMKDTFVDVKAQLADKTTVIIEMQVLNHPGFEKRVLYNAAKNYSMQLVKGERFDLLKPVIALNIVNFEMFEDSKQMISAFKMINKHDFTDYSDDIELIFIELRKFTKTLEQCEGIQDDWLFFVKNAGDMTKMPKNLPPQVNSAYEVSNEAGMTTEELELQYKKKEWIAIQTGSLVMAEQIGEARGELKGKEFGAINLLRESGMSDEKVARIIGLTISQVAELRKSLELPT